MSLPPSQVDQLFEDIKREHSSSPAPVRRLPHWIATSPFARHPWSYGCLFLGILLFCLAEPAASLFGWRSIGPHSFIKIEDTFNNVVLLCRGMGIFLIIIGFIERLTERKDF